MVRGGITSKQRQHAFQNTFQRKNNNLYKLEILSESLIQKVHQFEQQTKGQ